MKLITSFALSISLAVASSAAAQPVVVAAPVSGSTVINFNALDPFTPITNQFASLGVTVTGACFMSNNPGNGFFGNDPMQATNFDAFGQDCAGGTSYPAITFSFASTIHYFGFLGVSNGNIFLTNANGSASVFAPVAAATFVGVTDAIGFNSITLTASANGALELDDISFTQITTTPEPASIAMLGAGMLLVGAATRRKRSNA